MATKTQSPSGIAALFCDGWNQGRNGWMVGCHQQKMLSPFAHRGGGVSDGVEVQVYARNLSKKQTSWILNVAESCREGSRDRGWKGYCEVNGELLDVSVRRESPNGTSQIVVTSVREQYEKEELLVKERIEELEEDDYGQVKDRQIKKISEGLKSLSGDRLDKETKLLESVKQSKLKREKEISSEKTRLQSIDWNVESRLRSHHFYS